MVGAASTCWACDEFAQAWRHLAFKFDLYESGSALPTGSRSILAISRCATSGILWLMLGVDGDDGGRLIMAFHRCSRIFGATRTCL